MESKDPINKPKGVVSAMHFYRKHTWTRIKEENKGIDSRAISKKANEEWATLDATGRTPFKLMHEEDKKRFAMEMATDRRHNHMDENENEDNRSNPNTESKHPTTKPKGFVSAYSFWCRCGQKKLGKKWTALDSAAKSPYVHMHVEDEKRHSIEMVAYQNAFLIFMKHNRERIMEENACLCLHETSNKCGKE